MKQVYWKLAVASIGLIYCFYYVSTIDQWHFIDNVDLLIHEAGHVVFFPLGPFLYIAGGSLMQLIMPTLFVGYFYFRKEFYSSFLLLYWLGINFFSVAHYASDAVTMRLELLGGDSSGHDWHNLLSMMGLLNQTKFISTSIYILGFACIILGFSLSFLYLYDPKEQ